MTEIINNNKDSDKPVNSILIIEYFKIILSYKYFIIISTIIVALIVTILVYFILQPIFYSSGSVKTTGKSSSGLASMLGGGNLPDIGGLSDLAGGSASKELALYENILISRRCIEEIIIKFDLMSEWKIKFMQDAIKNFRENVLDIKKDKVAGTIEIGANDVDPQRAKDITEFLIFQLNKINTEMNIQNAKSNREFIETRYNQTLVDLKKAEDSLKQYQDIYGFAPDVQVKAVTQTEVQLEAEIKSEQLKLDLIKKILSPEQSEVKQQEDKINFLQKTLDEIKNSTDNSTKLRLKGTPDIILNYFRLSRNVEIQNKILTTILPIFEQAKIEEKRETPSVIILDSPFLPEHKIKPKRITSILISIMVTLVLTSVASIFYHTFFKKLREHF
jgi:tyrosine-protein kinase Etk/Wzc